MKSLASLCLFSFSLSLSESIIITSCWFLFCRGGDVGGLWASRLAERLSLGRGEIGGFCVTHLAGRLRSGGVLRRGKGGHVSWSISINGALLRASLPQADWQDMIWRGCDDILSACLGDNNLDKV